MIITPEPMTRRRWAVGTWGADGDYTDGASTDSKFSGSFQSLSRLDRSVLPEGLRSKVQNRITAPRGTLRRAEAGSAGWRADQVIRCGVVYAVVHVDDAHPLISHERVYVVREQEAE